MILLSSDGLSSHSLICSTWPVRGSKSVVGQARSTNFSGSDSEKTLAYTLTLSPKERVSICGTRTWNEAHFIESRTLLQAMPVLGAARENS